MRVGEMIRLGEVKRQDRVRGPRARWCKSSAAEK